MTTRMMDLPEYQKAVDIYFIGRGNPDDLHSICPALVDGKLNSTGHDLALFFRRLTRLKHIVIIF